MLFRGKKLPWSITGSLGNPFEAKPAKLWVLRSAAPVSYLLGGQGDMEAPFKKDARKLAPDRRWGWTGILAELPSQPRSKVRSKADSVRRYSKVPLADPKKKN